MDDIGRVIASLMLTGAAIIAGLMIVVTVLVILILIGVL